MESIKNQIEEKVLEYITIAEKMSGHTFPMPSIRFDLRGRCAGQYCVKVSRYTGITSNEYFRFNVEMAVQNGQAFIDRTVPHEVAHFIARHLHYGKNVGHDYRWQNIMTQYFKSDPSRCHNYDMENVTVKRQRRIEYRCACQSHEITTARHNKVLRGTVYTCRSCREPIKLVA